MPEKREVGPAKRRRDDEDEKPPARRRKPPPARPVAKPEKRTAKKTARPARGSRQQATKSDADTTTPPRILDPKLPPGRPTKLTEETAQTFIGMLRTGVAIEPAARASGLHERTVWHWLERGRIADAHLEAGEEVAPLDRLCSQLLNAVEVARAEAEALASGVLLSCMGDTTALWADRIRAAKEYLQRAHPERWAMTLRQELTGGEGGPVLIEETVRRAPDQPIDDKSVARLIDVMGRSGLLVQQPAADPVNN